MKLKVLVYYHNDLDGRCSAAIVKKAMPDYNYTFVPMGYNQNQPLPKNIENYWRVYIVDFTMPEDFMESLGEHFASQDIIWIEHHITAIEQYGEKFSSYEGIRKDGIAASLLTWRYFYGEKEAPIAVQHIADRDLWYFKLEGTRRFHEYMIDYNYFPSDSKWEHYLNIKTKLNNELAIGEVILNHKMKTIKKDVTYLGYESLLDGIKCLKINYSSFEVVSDMGHYICEKLGYDIAWMYYVKKDDEGKFIQVNNLRSKKDIDVSEIAKIRGGGGHKNAAGFASIPWVE